MVLPLTVSGVSRTKSCTRFTSSGETFAAAADAVAKQRIDVVTKEKEIKADLKRI